MEKRFYTASEVAEIMGVSSSKAYVIIRKLNKELESAGYITIAGKVPIAYLNERMYCRS